MNLFRFICAHRINDRVSVLYNPITQDALYYDNLRYDNPESIAKDVCSSDYADLFIGSSSYKDYTNAHFAHRLPEKIEFRILKMFVTTKCNLNCKYCLIEKNIRYRGGGSTNLSYTNGRRIIDDFIELCKLQPASHKTIMLYGGEPLLNWSVLNKIIDYIREKEISNAFNGNVELVLETNGTLMTPEIVQKLTQNNVSTIVSIDGIETVHNYYRRDKSGRGSWDAAINGYKLLKQAGCMVVVSSVFTNKYAENLEACLEYAHNTLKTPSIGLNLLHFLQDNEAYRDNTLNILDYYIKAFEIACEMGLYIEHIMRRIRPLVEKSFRFKDCGACGKRVVSDCNGNFGICEAFIGDETYFYNRGNIFSIYDDPQFKLWNQRTVLKMPNCEKCLALAICGGGCVNNAIQEFGNIYAPDSYICESSKAFVRWALVRWFNDNHITESIEKTGYHYLTDSERMSILKNVKLSYSIPLQNMSKQNEHKQ